MPVALPPAPVAQCVAQAAARYQVPELLLYSIMKQEGGAPGVIGHNRNGTVDMGRMQINSSWLAVIGPWGYSAQRLIYDDCANIMVAAWILKGNQLRAGGDWNAWGPAIQAYNAGWQGKSTKPRLAGRRYAHAVLLHWWKAYRFETAPLSSRNLAVAQN